MNDESRKKLDELSKASTRISTAAQALKQEMANNSNNADTIVGRITLVGGIVISIASALTIGWYLYSAGYNNGYQDGVLAMSEKPCDYVQCQSYIIDTERRCEIWTTDSLKRIQKLKVYPTP
jgi:hypothetical protein